MLCPHCRRATKVIDSRFQSEHDQVWRRRQCTQCSYRFTSSEVFLKESDQYAYDTFIASDSEPVPPILPDVPSVGEQVVIDEYSVYNPKREP